MLGSDRHSSASCMRGGSFSSSLEPSSTLLQETSGHTTSITLLSVIYVMIIHLTWSSSGRGFLSDSLVFPFGVQHNYAHTGWGGAST